MAKLTKVFGAIFCVLGTIYLIVSVFLYMNTSAFLNYNEVKQMTFIHSKTLFFFFVSILLLAAGIIFAKDRVIDNKKH